MFLPVNVTNRIEAGGSSPEIVLSVDTGSGPLPAGVAGVVSANSVQFSGFRFTLPETGRAALRVSNLRGAVNQLPAAPGQQQPIRVFLGASNLALSRSEVTVGTAVTGLRADLPSAEITRFASPLPATLTFSNLLGVSAFASTRLTEGGLNAFQKRGPGDDHGTRIAVRYSFFPRERLRLFVPDVVAGSTAVEPTAGGDLDLPASGGRYAPGGAGSLLLVRVLFPNEDGSGGTLAFRPGAPGSGTVSFNSVSEVPLRDGSGLAVYEVMDDNPSLIESAQFPTFLGLERSPIGAPTALSWSVSFAPASTAAMASASAPIPRFAPAPPPADTGGDPPKLAIEPSEFQFSAPTGARMQTKYLHVNNAGGGFLKWTAAVTYQTGTDWLRLDAGVGLNTATIRVDALPEKLAAGTYQASIRIDTLSGAGSQTVPVTLQVTPPPPPVQSPLIEAVTNAATFRPGPLVPGSLATILGSRLSGTGLSVTLDGMTAPLLFTSDRQINLQVPAELGSRATAQLIVAAGGASSTPFQVALAPIAPGIFGILNQDNTLNRPASPAPVGTVIQVFATGLPSPDAGVITAKIHDRTIPMPLYAGPAPGLPGVQQVNFTIPADLPAMTSEVLVCGQPRVAPSHGTSPVCSPPATIVLSR